MYKQLAIGRLAILLAVTSFLLFACQNQEPVVEVESTPLTVSEGSILIVANAEELERDFELVFSSDMSKMGFEERLKSARGIGEMNEVDALIVGTPTEMPSAGDYWFQGREEMKLGWVLGVKFVDL